MMDFTKYPEIPEHMQDAIVRYVENYIAPGDFLTAIICNDLMEAVGRADDENLSLIPVYVRFFYNETPGNCWHSQEKMRTWLAQRQP